jgi:DNA-binding MarR family transcriptional regulator
MSASLRSESLCITAALRAASRRLTLLYDEVMAPSGLRLTQFNLMAELERRHAFPPTVGELAEILTIERSALGQTLKPLERDGLIALGRDEHDGRRRPVRLTSTGREAVARARPYWTTAHQSFAGFFGEPEMAELRATLRDIAENPRVASASDRHDAPSRRQDPSS